MLFFHLKQLSSIAVLLFHIIGGQAMPFHSSSSTQYNIFHLDDILQNKISFDNHSSDTPFCQSNQPLPIVTPGSTILLETNGTFHDYSLSWYEAASRNRNSTINEVIYADDVHWLATSQVGSASIIGEFKIPRYLRRSSVYMIYGLTNVEPEEQFWILPLCITISSKNTARHVPSMATPSRGS